jgi:hypothetical protein
MVMAELTIHGIPFVIQAYSGTIIHQRVFQNLETTITGGGGTIGPDIFGDTRGKISPIRTHTQTIITQEVHYRDSSGREDYFRLTNRNLPLREGQEISLVYVTGESVNRLFFLAIHNLGKKYLIQINYDPITNTIYESKYRLLHSIISIATGVLLGYLCFVAEAILISLLAVIAGHYFTIRILRHIKIRNIEAEVAKKIDPFWENL